MCGTMYLKCLTSGLWAVTMSMALAGLTRFEESSGSTLINAPMSDNLFRGILSRVVIPGLDLYFPAPTPMKPSRPPSGAMALPPALPFPFHRNGHNLGEPRLLGQGDGRRILWPGYAASAAPTWAGKAGKRSTTLVRLLSASNL